MKNKIFIVILFFVFGLISQMPKALANRPVCHNDCYKGDTCYPDPGFECNTISHGDSCNDLYNCEY